MYLCRYERSRRLSGHWNRWRPSGSRTLYVSGRWSKNGWYSGRNWHSNRDRAHRVPRSGIRQRWRRMSMMNSLRMRRTSRAERGWGSILARYVRPGWPTTPWPGFSMGFRRRLRHLWLFRCFSRCTSIT